MKNIKTKKLAAFLIALVMMLSLIPTQVWAVPTSERYGATAIGALENGENFIWAYSKLKDGVENCETSISFKDATHSISLSDFKMVHSVYLNDNPQHFWNGSAYGYATAENSDNVSLIEPQYSMTGETLATARSAYDTAVTEALSGITEDMSDFEKELYLHDYLVKHVDYVKTGYNSRTAYGALVEGKAVCEGYARAFQHLLMLSGIPSFVVTGQSDGVAHAWNLVKIDGSYYYVDVTWDDKGRESPYGYFNVTTAQLTEDHTIDQQPYELPVCTATAANYHTVNGGKVSIGDVDAIADLLDAGNLSAHLYVTGAVYDFELWFGENIDRIVESLGITSSYTYNYTISGHGINLHLIADNYTHHHRLSKVEAVAATCKDTGSAEYWHCFRCDKNYADAEGTKELTSLVTAIDPDNHAGGTEIRNQVTASCEQNGYSGDTYCKDCGEKISTGTTIPKPHSMSFVAAVPSTCKDAGTKEHWHCSKCNKDFADKAGDVVLTNLSLPMDPSNHAGGTVIKNESAATCTKDGNTGDTYCKGCDTKLISGTAIPASHQLSKINATAATCKDTGNVEHWHCSRCNKNYADAEGKKVLSNVVIAVNPDNHVGGTEIRNQVTASCEQNGYSGDTYCKGCDKKLTAGATIPKTHSMSFIATVPSTCKDAGTKEHWHCSKCNKDFADEAGEEVLTNLSLPLDSNNHAHFKDGWEYDAEGHWQVCADCMNGTGEKTAHIYDGVSGSICVICGYVAPAVPTRGDLNGNGSKADAGDMQCLYTYLIDGSIVGAYKDSPDMFVSVADVNNDGKVDVYDLQRLYEAAA